MFVGEVVPAFKHLRRIAADGGARGNRRDDRREGGRADGSEGQHDLRCVVTNWINLRDCLRAEKNK